MKNDLFFDRSEYLQVLHKRVSGLKDGYRQNLAILGDELVGKTSIIFKFLRNFSDNRIIVIYLECRPESLNSFVKRFLGNLLYNFLINSGDPLEEDLDFLISKAAKFIPKTVEKIKNIISLTEKKKKNNIFSSLLSLTESIHEETNKCCVVMLDEFQILESFNLKTLYNEWSKILVLQKNTMYVILSSQTYKSMNILSKDLSLLFGNFEIIKVEPFDIKTSNIYLNNKLSETKIEEGIKNFIVHFTGGYPFYLEIISNALIKSIPHLNIIDILEELLFSPSGILNQKFSNYLKRFSILSFHQDFISILYLISNGHNKVKEIAHIMQKTQKEINLLINQMLELDALVKSGDFLKINDRVFSFWLKFVYQNKSQSFTFDAKNQKALFRNNINLLIKDFLVHSEKPIIERMKEVLNLFQDETIQLEKKRLRLNHFREIKPLEFKNRSIKEGLIGRSSDSLWILGLNQDTLTEEDIAEFAKECKKYRHKLQRKIIVYLREIDSNAKLRAFEEKILAWDINSLNQIFDLFYKPRVIV